MRHDFKTSDDRGPSRAAAEPAARGESAGDTGWARTSQLLTTQREQIVQVFGPRLASRAASAHGKAPVQRKPVPKLTDEGRVCWYDDQDPLRTLYDSEAACLLHNPQLPIEPASPVLYGQRPVKLFDVRGHDFEALLDGLDASRRQRQEELEKRFAREFDQNPRLRRVALRALELLSDLAETERVTDDLIEHDLDQAAQDDRLLRLVIGGRAGTLRTVLSHVKYDALLVSTLLEDGWALTDIAAMAPPWGLGLWKLAAEYQSDKGVCATAMWSRLACAHAALAGQAAAVATFARMAGWSNNERLQLVHLFGGNAGHCNATQWAQLAGADPALQNQAAVVAGFARVPGWTFAHLLTLATCFGRKPRGCTAQEWAQLAAQPGLADQHAAIIELLAVPGWTAASRLALAGLFGVNAGVCDAEQWGALAAILPVNQAADVAVLARIAGWAFSAIRTMARAIGADLAGGRNATFVAAVASQLPADSHEETLALVSIANWSQINVCQLAAAFRLNPGAFGAREWAQIAGADAGLLNLDAEVSCFARVPRWTLSQLKALAINFAVNAGPSSAVDWAQIAAAHAGSPAQCVAVTEFARMPAWNVGNRATLALLFGTNHGVCNAAQWAQLGGAHPSVIDQEWVVAAFARIAGWTPANLVALAGLFGANPGVCNETQWAQLALAHASLLNQESNVAVFARIAGWTPASLVALATAFGTDSGGRTAAEWALIALAHISLVDMPTKVAGCARIPLGAVPALVIFLNNCGATVSAVSGLTLVRELAGRGDANWPSLQQVCLNLPPMPFTVANCLTLVRDHLPLLSVPLILRRLTVHGLPVGPLAPDAMLDQLQQDMTRLNQSMNQRGIPGYIQNEVRIAFQLRNWRATQLTEFFRSEGVTNKLGLAAGQNPAHWLYLFALHHVAGALPVGGVAQGLPFANAYGIGNITINQASIDHIRQGHTWENFLFTQTNIDRAAHSTLFDVGVTNQNLFDRLHEVLDDPNTVRAGLDVTRGAVQVWLLGGMGNPVSTMYYAVPGGYGTRVPKEVLHAMRNNTLF